MINNKHKKYCLACKLRIKNNKNNYCFECNKKTLHPCNSIGPKDGLCHHLCLPEKLTCAFHETKCKTCHKYNIYYNKSMSVCERCY